MINPFQIDFLTHRYTIDMQTYPNRAVFRNDGWTAERSVVKSLVILERDKKILVDIAKKVYKGSALTDKQYEVVKRILVNRYASTI